MAYSTFNAATDYIHAEVLATIKSINPDGSSSSLNNIYAADFVAGMVAAAKDYVDAGVDGIEYDIDGYEVAGASFDADSVAQFNAWLVSDLGYTEAQLTTLLGVDFPVAGFDYGAYVITKGVTVTARDPNMNKTLTLGPITARYWVATTSVCGARFRQCVSVTLCRN